MNPGPIVEEGTDEEGPIGKYLRRGSDLRNDLRKNPSHNCEIKEGKT